MAVVIASAIRDGCSYAEFAFLRCDPCSYCGGPGGTIDHIVPRAAGAAPTDTNLTGACEPCNAMKAAWPLLPFLMLRAAGP